MKARLWRIAKLALYPLFYLGCLLAFFYLTFPFDALRSRLIAEFERSQRAGGARGSLSGGASKGGMQLEVKELGGYWLSGVELRSARLIFPPERRSPTSMASFGKTTTPTAEEPVPEPSAIAIEQAHVRIRLLPLLIGRVRIDFGAKAFGGELSGSVPYGGSSGDVEVALDKLQLSEVQPLRALLGGLPMLGTVGGQLTLTPKEGKFAKADGKLDLKLERVVLGDGKALLQGVALPAAQIGDIVITATAKDGVLKIAEISAQGRDIELQGEGKIRIKEPWQRSQADIYLKFRFTDAYRDRDDATRGLLGAPGGKLPGAIDYNPTIKRAKQDDGFYAWHIHGPLGELAFDPQATQSKATRTRAGSAKSPSGRPSGAGGKVRRTGREGGDESGDEASAPPGAGDGVRELDAPRLAPAPELPPSEPARPTEAPPTEPAPGTPAEPPPASVEAPKEGTEAPAEG